MRSLSRTLARLRKLISGSSYSQRFREETEFHISLQTDENIRAGMSPHEARRQARIKFGSLEAIRESYHAQESFRFVEEFSRDFRQAVRRLRKSRSFAITAILTMALGIGATSLVFSIFYAVVVSPYPYRDAEHIVQMGFIGKQGLRGFMAVNTADLGTVKRASTVADAMLTDFADPITTVAGYPEDVEVARLSDGAFDLLGVPPLFGRTLGPQDHDQQLIVLGYHFCRSHFQCDPSVLGRTVDLDHRQFIVVGVMPPRFAWQEASAFIPLGKDANTDEAHSLFLRPKEGVSGSECSDQMLTLIRQFVLANEGVQLPTEIHLVSTPIGQRNGNLVEKRVILLFAAVCILLLIACVNVSILLLGRARIRQHEFRVRHALGASRLRITYQVLVESSVIAACGGILGIAFTLGGGATLRSSLVKSFFPPEAVLDVNMSVLVFSTLVTIGTGILFGLIPGLHAARTLSFPRANPQLVSQSTGSRRSQRTLVACQVALALVLLAIAGASIRSFIAIYKMEMGYNPHNLLTFRLPLSESQNQSWTTRVQYRTDLRESLSRIPGVVDASIDEAMPTGGGMQMEYGLPEEHYGADMDAEMPRADFEFVDNHYLSLLGIPVLMGRGLGQADLDTAEPVALINETFARRLFGTDNPVGRTLRLPPLVAGYEDFALPPHPTQIVHIIGVARDVRAAWFGSAPSRETIYLPESLFATSHSLQVHVRTSGDPLMVLGTVRRVIDRANPTQAISNPRTLDEILSDDLRSRDRWLAILTGAFSGSALFLAAIGLYSVASFAVNQRTREFGLRIALGATRDHILGIALLSEMRAVLAGIGVGALLTFFIQRTLGSTMNLPSMSPLYLIPACLTMLIVSAFASHLPARRAAGIDPNETLRTE